MAITTVEVSIDHDEEDGTYSFLITKRPVDEGGPADDSRLDDDFQTYHRLTLDDAMAAIAREIRINMGEEARER